MAWLWLILGGLEIGFTASFRFVEQGGGVAARLAAAAWRPRTVCPETGS